MEQTLDLGEQLRNVMRRWPTGVSIVTSQYEGVRHGMTVNSLTSISIKPPMIAVTLAHKTRTYRLVKSSGVFGVTLLSEDQAHLSDLFAGKISEDHDRFAGFETFSLVSGVPFLSGGQGFMDCRVVHTFEMQESTLFVGQVAAVRWQTEGSPLIYLNRNYHRLEE